MFSQYTARLHACIGRKSCRACAWVCAAQRVTARAASVIQAAGLLARRLPRQRLHRRQRVCARGARAQPHGVGTGAALPQCRPARAEATGWRCGRVAPHSVSRLNHSRGPAARTPTLALGSSASCSQSGHPVPWSRVAQHCPGFVHALARGCLRHCAMGIVRRSCIVIDGCGCVCCAQVRIPDAAGRSGPGDPRHRAADLAPRCFRRASVNSWRRFARPVSMRFDRGAEPPPVRRDSPRAVRCDWRRGSPC